jgi:hypothetical protein
MIAPVAELAGCASAAVLLAYGLCDAARKLAPAARRLPRAVSVLAEGLVCGFAWWLAGGVQGLRHHPRAAQHCTRHAPAAVAVARPAPLPGPFPPVPRPAEAAESMTPLGPDTAVQVALVQPYTDRPGRWE